MKFLTSEAKERYMKDFNENVLTCTHKYWGIDLPIRNILIEINKNSEVQTLYSKCGKDIESQSYLFVSVTENFYPKLAGIVELLKSKVGRFSYFVNEPTIHVNNDVKMGCNRDEEHFNTSVFCFYCTSKKREAHLLFWHYLAEKFAS